MSSDRNNHPVPSEANRPLFTRRRALPALAGSVGACIAGAGGLGLEAFARTNPVDEQVREGRPRVYDVRSFGAKGDSATLDTAAVQTAIDRCNAEGGGTVLIPTGTFLIGTIELKSNVTLYIAESGKLLGSGRGIDYHAVDAIPLKGDSTLEDGNWALLFAVGARNVTIEGSGVIDGQGAQFHSPVRGTPPPSGIGGNKRPYHMLFYQCENLKVRDINLLESAYHSVRVIQCQRVHMDGIYIHNRVNSNNDGFHFISAEYVTVTNCVVKSLDDACALFGSCRDVMVTNSYFSTRWSVFRFGGGKASNIAVSNCVLHQVYGCPIKFHGTPGTRFENMSFSNLILDDVTGPIHFSAGPRQQRREQSGPTPTDALIENRDEPPCVVRNVVFSNIHGTVTTNPQQMEETALVNHHNPGELHSCITLSAVAGATIEKVSFDNIHLTFGGGGTAEDAARRELPEIAGEYFMLGPMPAYGFYARNARAITLNNVRLETAMQDLRPAIILDHMDDVTLSSIAVDGCVDAESTVRMIDSTRVLMTAPRLLSATKNFLAVEGEKCARIVVEGGDLDDAQEKLAATKGADHSSVTFR